MRIEVLVETVAVKGKRVEVHVDKATAFNVWHLFPVMWVLCHQRIHGAGRQGRDGHVYLFVWYRHRNGHFPHARSHCGAILS